MSRASSYLARVFRASEAENRRAILRLLPEAHGGTLLDVGTGNGRFATEVGERLGARQILGVELLDKYAHAATARGIEVAVANLEQGIPFADGCADTVHGNQIIEHLRNTDRFLAEIRRVLRPGGIACLSTNNLASWHNVLSLAAGLQPASAHVSDERIVGNPLNPEQGLPHVDRGRVHVRLFTGRALTEAAELHGLEPLKLRTSGYYPLPPLLARAAVRADPLHGAFLIALFRRRD